MRFESVNLGGGFRINLSISGFGNNWGTKEYRIAKTAKETTGKTAAIPTTNISFVDEIKKIKVLIRHSISQFNNIQKE